MAGLGKWEEVWKESIKASVLHGTEEFAAGMLKNSKVIEKSAGKSCNDTCNLTRP